MVSLYVKGKENGHVQAYAPTGAMGLKRWGGGLTSKLDGLPSLQTHTFGGKPVHDENRYRVKLRLRA